MAYALAEPEVDFELPDGWRMIGSPKRVRAGGISHAWRTTYTKTLPPVDGQRQKAPVLILTVGVHSGKLLDWRYLLECTPAVQR